MWIDLYKMRIILKFLKYLFFTFLFLFLCIFFILFLSLDTGYYVYHKGKYKDKKAIGEFEFRANYRLDNGNDGSSFAKGSYDENSLRQGFWINETAYSQGLYLYKDGIMIESIYTYPIQKVIKETYDENGTLLESRIPTKDECKHFFSFFDSMYKNECFEILKDN